MFMLRSGKMIFVVVVVGNIQQGYPWPFGFSTVEWFNDMHHYYYYVMYYAQMSKIDKKKINFSPSLTHFLFHLLCD
mgnify:CR=1 FL=1